MKTRASLRFWPLSVYLAVCSCSPEVMLWTCSGTAQDLPFSERELMEALSARAPEVESASLRIERVGQLIVVTLGGRARALDLSGSSGMDAARVVALVASDLSQRDDYAIVSSAPLAAPVITRLERTRLGVEGSVLRGLQRDDNWGFTLGLHSDVVVRAFVLSLQAAYWTMPTERPHYSPTHMRFDALLLRAAIGVQLSRYVLAVGPTYAHAWVRTDRAHKSELFGASLQATLWLRASPQAQLGLRACLDMYVRRAFFDDRNLSDGVVATPAFAFGLALAAALGRT